MEDAKSTTPVKELDLNQKFMAALTYLLGFVTGAIFLTFEKKDKFIRYHAYQSILVSILWLVVVIFIGIIPFPVPFLQSFINLLLWIGFFVIWVFLMVKAFNGEQYKLPYIGEWAEKQVAKE